MVVEVAVVSAVVLMAACGKDAEPDAAVEQQAAAPTPAPATKAAPAPRPAAPSAEALAATELANAPRVRTVQVSAYPNAPAARWWVQELQRQGIPAYVTTASVDGQEYTRLRIGAAVTGAEARAIAEKIHARYDWPTWIVMVEDKTELPANALSLSRTYVGGR
jgi:cell division septation protein DedD